VTSSDSRNANQQVTHVLVIVEGSSEETIDIVEITRFSLKEFCAQFDVPVQYDPEMLEIYVVGPDDVSFLKSYLDREIIFNFSSQGYWIEAVTK
jgi:hypothetical protein